MKVTALLPTELINEIKLLTNGKNITESLKIALEEWLSLKHIKQLNEKLENNPLKFKEDFTAEKNREINRK